MSRLVLKREKLRRVLHLLEKMYGKHAWARRGAGLDVLIEAMLSQNTNMANARRGYAQLRRQFSTWPKVLAAPVGDVQRCIAICGLARMRARRLQALLATIKAQRRGLSIEFLADADSREAYDYLTGFHGIGPKTAAFTLLFGFGHPVLPVDNGVLRVLRRTRLVRPKARDAEAERVMSPVIPAGKHYALHVLLFRHAKSRCRPKNPKCDDCAVLAVCPFGQRRVRHLPPTKEELPRLGKVILSRYASGGLAKRDTEPSPSYSGERAVRGAGKPSR
jgi:endonuclease-3